MSLHQLSEKACREMAEAIFGRRQRLSASARMEWQVFTTQLFLPFVQWWEGFCEEYGSTLQPLLEAYVEAQQKESNDAVHQQP